MLIYSNQPQEHANTQLKNGNFIVENRYDLSALFHVKFSHMLQTYFLLSAWDDKQIAREYFANNERCVITIKDIFDGFLAFNRMIGSYCGLKFVIFVTTGTYSLLLLI